MLYAVEINEPAQVTKEDKFRCYVQTDDGGGFSWTSKPERTFATEDKEAAEAIAATLDKSWDATVVPVEEGTQPEIEDSEIVEAFKARERERRVQSRQVR
jgi:hypothetical protein